MCAHVTALKRTTHPHWKALPSQAIQEELKRIDAAYVRFFKKLGGRPEIKKWHKFKSFTLKQTGWSLKDNRITLTFKKWDAGKWRYDKVAYTFHKHREFYGNISRITIKRDACGNYYLYMVTDFVETKPLPTAGQSVGADNVIQGMDLVYSQTKSGMKDARLDSVFQGNARRWSRRKTFNRWKNANCYEAEALTFRLWALSQTR